MEATDTIIKITFGGKVLRCSGCYGSRTREHDRYCNSCRARYMREVYRPRVKLLLGFIRNALARPPEPCD